MENQNKFIKIGTTKVGVMTFFTSIVYPIYWFYKQWARLRKTDPQYKKISPFGRALLFPVYAFPLAKIIKQQEMFLTEEEKAQKAKPKTFDALQTIPWTFVLAVPVFIIIFAFDVPSSVGTGLAFLLIYGVAQMQTGINYILPEETIKERAVKLGDVLCFFVLIILLLGLLFGALFTPYDGEKYACFSENKVEGSVLTNDCLGYKITFPYLGEVRSGDSYVYQHNEDAGVDIFIMPDNYSQDMALADREKMFLETYGSTDKKSVKKIETIKGRKMLCEESNEGAKYTQRCSVDMPKGTTLNITQEYTKSAPNFAKFIESIEFFEPKAE